MNYQQDLPHDSLIDLESIILFYTKIRLSNLRIGLQSGANQLYIQSIKGSVNWIPQLNDNDIPQKKKKHVALLIDYQ